MAAWKRSIHELVDGLAPLVARLDGLKQVANDADRAEHSLDLVRIWTRWVERRDDLGEYWQVVDAQRHTKRG